MSTRVSVTISGEPKTAPGIVGAFGGTTPAHEILVEAETDDLSGTADIIDFITHSTSAATVAVASILGAPALNQED